MQRCEVCGHENRDGAKFCEECAAILSPRAASHEVRKTVTVVFCDVSGSTGIGEAIDPESVRRVMERFFQAMQAAIEHQGAPSRSSSATRSWPSSARRRLMRTMRCAPSVPRARCAPRSRH